MPDEFLGIEVPQGLDSHLSGLSGPVLHYLERRMLDDMAQYVASRAQLYAPKRTGNLAANISSTKASRTSGGDVWQSSAGIRRQAHYGVFVEKGTGIYGRGTPIRAAAGNVLVFTSKTHGTVFTPSVKGQKGQKFMQRAFHDLSHRYIPYRIAQFKAEVATARQL